MIIRHILSIVVGRETDNQVYHCHKSEINKYYVYICFIICMYVCLPVHIYICMHICRYVLCDCVCACVRACV